MDIKVSGEDLAADWVLAESSYSLRATVLSNASLTAEGTLTVKSGQRPAVEYAVRLYLSQNGRGISLQERNPAGIPRVNTSISRPDDWKPGAEKAEKEDSNILSYSYQLGNEIPLTESKAIALRISIKVKDEYRAKYSIAGVEFVPKVFSEISLTFNKDVHYAPAVDSTDGFHVYTGVRGVNLEVPAGAKEANFEFPSVDFGFKLGTLSFPKDFQVLFKVKVQSAKGERVENLEVPIRINSLFTVGVENCGKGGPALGCPRFKNATLTPGKKANGVMGDELVIPMDARLWVKFLDGSVGYFVNQTDVEWKLTMGFGHFNTTQGSGYTENKLEINAVISKALESGAGKAADKTAEAALEMILRRTASQTAPGVILQLIESFSGARLGGDFVAIRLRSQVGISLRQNGEIVVRNFEGSPEILQSGLNPLPIPQGYQVKKPKGLAFGKAERYTESDPAVAIWKNKTGAEISPNTGSGNLKILDAGLPGSLTKWSEIYNPADKNPAFSYEEIPLGNNSVAIRTSAAGNTLASCESKWIKRVYETGLQNSSNSILEVTADFSFNGTTYNLPSIAVELLDEKGRSLGNKNFFGKDVIGSFNRSKLQSTGHIELDSATGVHNIPLSKIGANIKFSKLAIYLMNYTCQGENSIIFKRLEIKQ